MKMKRRLLTALATAALAAAATLTIFAASPKDEAAIRYLEQQPLPLDSIIMRLEALEPYGVSYEQVGGGLQMYYNGYPVTRMTYWDADTKPGPGYTFTSINPPEPTRASITLRVRLSATGDVRIEQGKPGSAEMWKVDGRILYDEEQGVWTYQEQVIRYFVNGVDGQFPTLLQEDGTVSVQVTYDQNHYVTGVKEISNEQAAQLMEQALAE